MAESILCDAALNFRHRSNFLRDIAAELSGKELGDGLALRTCRELQRRFMTSPPHVARHTPRWGCKAGGIRESTDA
jgi:hypothetical protein